MARHTMTREQARQSMLDGELVSHINFAKGEYLSMIEGRIMTEDGYFFGDLFDSYEWMADGWSIYPCPKP